MERTSTPDKTHVIARIVASYLLVTGLGFVVSGGYYSKMIAHAASDPVLINLSGMVHFFIGMTILVVHFQWKSKLQVIVTLLGAMFFLKGFFLIALPELTLQTGNNPVQKTGLMGACFIAAGASLGYAAFFRGARGHVKPTPVSTDTPR